MKTIKELPLDLAEKLELPMEILPGAGRISITGGRQAYVEDHRGIVEYSEDRVVLALKRGKIIINGAGMRLSAMNGSELIVSGRIESVEWA